jgi:hypothetical protein
MINLSRELDGYAELGAEGAAKRLADADTRAALRSRIARGRRRVNVAVAVALAAVLGIGAAAWAAPRDTVTNVEPSAFATNATNRNQLPALDSLNYLTQITGEYRTDETLTCDIIPIAPVVEEGVADPESVPPLPKWIELDRIYGLPDLFPPSYPIPLYSRHGSPTYVRASQEIPQLYPQDAQILVALISDTGEWWGFTAHFQEIDIMPFDPAGIFVTLTPDPLCHGGPRDPGESHIPPGTYNARVMVNRTDIAYGNVIRDFGYLRVVTGLPSVPYLHVTK